MADDFLIADQVPESCLIDRSHSIEEILRDHFNLSNTYNSVAAATIIFLSSVLIYSLVRAYGEKYRQLGHNTMRWPFTRILQRRLAPVNDDVPFPSRERDPRSVGVVIKRDIVFTWKRTFSWLIDLLSYTEHDVERLAGHEGLRYIRTVTNFYVILLLLAVCSTILIAVHTLGGLGEALPDLWAGTTLANVSDKVQVGILHSGVGIITFTLVVVLCLITGYRNKALSLSREKNELNPAALFVSRVDEKDWREDSIKQYMSERTNGRVTVAKATLILKNWAALDALNRELGIMRETRDRLEKMLPTIEYARVSRFSLTKIDARFFYDARIKELDDEIKETLDRSPYTGSALVYFHSEKDAQEALHSLGLYSRMAPFEPGFLNYALARFYNRSDNPKGWVVSPVPTEHEICYVNLSVYQPGWNIVARVLKNMALVAALVLSILPTYAVSSLQNYEPFKGALSRFLWFPLLRFVWNAAVLEGMKNMDSILPTDPVKSKNQVNVMHWVFYTMTFSEVVLPVLAIEDIGEFVHWVVQVALGESTIWGWVACLYREQVGTEMASNLIMSAFLRSVLLVLRIPHFFLDIVPFSSFTPTEAEVRHRRKSISVEMGYRYADVLFLYAVAASVALVQPLVPWFAVYCVFIRYWVDKHILCHTYVPRTNAVLTVLHSKAIPLMLQPFWVQSGIHLLYTLKRDAAWRQDGELSLQSMIAIAYFAIVAVLNVAFKMIHFVMDWNRIVLFTMQKVKEAALEVNADDFV